MLETFRVDNMDTIFIVFLTIFSSAFGLFYYLVLKSLYRVKLSVLWPLFIIPPFMVVLTAILDPGYVPFACLVNFPILLALMLIGGVVKAIRSKNSIWGFLAFIVAMPLIMITWPYGIILITAFVILREILTPSSKNTFYELQGALPTSKIRSLAMGLVEVSGKTILIEPVLSAIKKVPCIGYLYKVDAINRDKNGKISYSNISKETVCNSFQINDGSGIITVSGDDLELIDLPESKYSYTAGDRRFQLFLLEENMKVLLIGKATNRNQQVFIEKDPSKDVFGVATYEHMKQWNLLRPLQQSFVKYLLILIACISVILTCEITVHENELLFSFKSLLEVFNLKESLPFQL